MYKINHLASGMPVISRHMPGVRSFAIGVYVKACSNYETAGQIGISHLIEHMMFKGTQKYSAKEIAETIDNIGGSMNAYTSKDCTAYYAKVLCEHADIAIDLLADMIQHSRFDDAELTKEIEVVKEEIAMYEDSPEDVVYDLFQQVVYGDHVLAQPILGYDRTIDQITRDDIFAYLRQYYTTDNSVIAISGYLPDNFMQLLNRAFADYTPTGKQVALPAAAFSGGYRCAHKDIEQRHMVIGFEGLPYGHDLHYAWLLISNVLGGTSSSLLFQTVREKNGLAYAIYSHPTFFKISGHLTIYTSYRPANQAKIITLIAQCLCELNDYFNADSLSKAKMQLKGSYMLGLESSASIMATLGKRSIYDVKLETMDEIMAAIDRITLDDVNGLIARISRSPIALSMVGQLHDDDVATVYEQLNCELRSS